MVAEFSDLFYPDNPYRKARAQELHNDVAFQLRDFKELQAAIDSQAKAMEPKLTKLLHSQGCDSVEELETKIKKVLDSDNLAKWKEMTERLDQGIFVDKVIYIISGVLTLATGIAMVGLWAVAIIGGPVILGSLMAIGGIVAAIGIIWSVINGGEERDELIAEIRDLAFYRVEVTQHLKRLTVYSNWLANFDNWLNIPEIAANPKLFERYLTGDFKSDMDGTERGYIIKGLHEMDVQRRSWTNADPDVTNPRPT